VDGIDRDRVSLDTSLGEIEDFFFLPNTIQLLRCGPTEAGPPDDATEVARVAQRSAGR
jgi:hypothetical protein